MPTLIRLNTCKVTMYAGDHLPPHFHIIANDGREALVTIAGFEVLYGNVGKAALNEAKAWALNSESALIAKWQELNP